MDFPVLGDCLKYVGNTKTYDFMIMHNVNININTYFFPEEDLVRDDFVNFNYKISEIFLNYVSQTITSEDKCITYYIEKSKLVGYVKAIFSNYSKEKYVGYTYSVNNNKTNKIYKSTLKKQINILYNFLNNENNYKPYNIII